MQNEETKKTHMDIFVEFLIKNKDDSAIMSKLRRGLNNPMQSPELFSVVIPRLPQFDEKERYKEQPYFMVAALFSFHPENSDDGTLGKSYRALKKGDDTDEAVEKRFTNLLNAHGEDLYVHLRQVVSILKSKDIKINWKQLIKDISYWSHESKFIQKNWARDFWSYQKNNQNNEKE